MISVKPPPARPAKVNNNVLQPSKNCSLKKQTVACIGCRKKKIKCSSDRPACSNCLRLNISCEYPITRNRGSRFGYREMLQRRLVLLSKYVDKSVLAPPVVELPASHSADSEVEHEAAIPNIPDMLPLDVATSADSIKNGESAYPPLDLVIHLTELYFENINSQTYSFLHKPTFMPRIEHRQVSPLLVYAICALSARFSKHPDIADPSDERPLYLAGERFLNRARHLLSMEFDVPSIETVQAVICLVQHEFFRSKGGRSMIYMAMAFPMALQLGLNREPSSNIPWIEQESRRRTFWSLVVLDRLGHATPLYSLQLNEKDFRNLALPCQAHRFIANIFTKTPSLSTPLEIANSKYDPRGIFSYHIEGTLLWNKANVFALKCQQDVPVELKEYREIEAAIEKFEKNLPDRFQYSYSRLEEFTAMRRVGHYVHVHCELQATKFLLYKNLCSSSAPQSKMAAIDPTTSSSTAESEEVEQLREAAMFQVISAANKLSEMLEDMSKVGDNIPIAPFVGYCIFIVSSVHVALSFSPDKKKAARAKQHLATNLKFLVDLREYWYIVGVWCVILKDRYSNSKNRHSPLNEFTEDESERSKSYYISRPSTPPPYLPDEYLNPSEIPQAAPPHTPPFDTSSSRGELQVTSKQDSSNSAHSTPLDHYLDDNLGLDWLVEVEGNKDFVDFDYNNPTTNNINIQKEASILDHILQTVLEKPVLH